MRIFEGIFEKKVSPITRKLYSISRLVKEMGSEGSLYDEVQHYINVAKEHYQKLGTREHSRIDWNRAKVQVKEMTTAEVECKQDPSRYPAVQSFGSLVTGLWFARPKLKRSYSKI